MGDLRVCMLLVAASALAGCTTLSTATLDTLQAVIGGNGKTLSPTAVKVAARPYYQLELQSDAGTAVLILGNIDHGRQAWYDAHDTIVFLRHGVLVKTSGMHADIIATRLPADSPFITGLEHLHGATSTMRQLDLPDYRYGITATSRLVPEGMHEVTILGQAHQLLRVEEHIRAPVIDFAATNRYWVDPSDGFIWKSRQTIPGGPTLTLTQLRPYRGAPP
ncbi:MAG TPA: YjbF family lipoprotein [Oleiagrimonas sp.]|nr:YjbF family lipoprotein [Oleiagrimonas sp.]